MRFFCIINLPISDFHIFGWDTESKSLLCIRRGETKAHVYKGMHYKKAKIIFDKAITGSPNPGNTHIDNFLSSDEGLISCGYVEFIHLENSQQKNAVKLKGLTLDGHVYYEFEGSMPSEFDLEPGLKKPIYMPELDPYETCESAQSYGW